MADPAFLGLDIGTSGVKALLVAGSGAVLGTAHAPLTVSTPRPGWTEQDPEAWWNATIAAVQRLKPTAVAAIGLSGQMHSSVFLDRESKVIRPAILWSDGRTTAECAEITRRAGGEERLREWVCNPALEGFTLPKILWLRNHEPAGFARLATVMLAKDYIRYRLTDTLATEPSDAAGTLLFDPAGGKWSAELLEAMQLNRSLLPDVGESSQVLGRISKAVAAATGLLEGTPVVGGGADNACGAAGVGVVSPGDAVSSWGTSGTVLAPMAEPRVDSRMRAHTFCHVAPKTWYLMGVVLSAGGAVGWFRDQLGGGSLSDEQLTDEAATVTPGAEGVTFLPYLQGERTPHRNAAMRAAFVGLGLSHTRAHLARAVLEGVCFALRDSLAILQEMGLSPEHLLLTGGGAKSSMIRQLQADVFGLPVSTVNREEGPAYGAALLAAVGVGAFPDLVTAARATLARSEAARPSAPRHAEYNALYGRFQAAYPAARLS